MNVSPWMIGFKLTHFHEINLRMRIASQLNMCPRFGKRNSVFVCRPIDSIYPKAVVDRIFIYLFFLQGSNMGTYYNSRYVNLYSSYHTDDSLLFLRKTPKGGFGQELHSVPFL